MQHGPAAPWPVGPSGARIKPVSPARQVFITEPPEKPGLSFFDQFLSFCFCFCFHYFFILVKGLAKWQYDLTFPKFKQIRWSKSVIWNTCWPSFVRSYYLIPANTSPEACLLCAPAEWSHQALFHWPISCQLCHGNQRLHHSSLGHKVVLYRPVPVPSQPETNHIIHFCLFWEVADISGKRTQDWKLESKVLIADS